MNCPMAHVQASARNLRSGAQLNSNRPLADDNSIGHIVITMIRTQISLSRAEYWAAKMEARRLGISLAELLRRSLRHMLPADASRPWMRYAGMVASGDSESSRHIDDIVYGQKD
jgi:hypothetical protein